MIAGRILVLGTVGFLTVATWLDQGITSHNFGAILVFACVVLLMIPKRRKT